MAAMVCFQDDGVGRGMEFCRSSVAQFGGRSLVVLNCCRLLWVELKNFLTIDNLISPKSVGVCASAMGFLDGVGSTIHPDWRLWWGIAEAVGHETRGPLVKFRGESNGVIVA